jgi:thiol-disulfide isomerase/thioredoxin
MKSVRVLALAAALVAPGAFALGIGDSAPPLALPDGAGQQVELSKLRGNVVYVDFWASWCGPCKRSFPWMNELSRKYASKGLQIVAINVDKKREDADRFLKGASAEFTVVYDAAGSAPAAWQVKSMPSSYLVDASGRIAWVESGFKDDRKAEVEDRIRAAIAAR